MAIIESNDFGYVEQKHLDNWAARYAEELIKQKESGFQAHKKNLVLDHPDGSVTREKLCPGLTDELDEITEGLEGERNRRIEQIKTVREEIGRKADAENTEGGFYGGTGALSKSGAAMGNSSEAYHGGAIGQGAKTSNGFAGGRQAVCQDASGFIDAVQLGEGVNDSVKTLQAYDYRLMEADGTIPAERIPQLNEKADRQNASGGFCAGEENDFTGVGVSIGRRASNVQGVAIGEQASNEKGVAIGNYSVTGGSGGAVGLQAMACHGGSIGQSAAADNGGAVGGMARAGNGFSGGYYAMTGKDIHNAYLDAIQLGRGTNKKEKTLQVYNYCLMEADGTVPIERLPRLQNCFAAKQDGGFMQIPSVNTRDMIIELKNPVIAIQQLSNDENGGYVYRITAQTSYEFYLYGEKKAGNLQIQTQHTLNPEYGQDQNMAYLAFQYETNTCELVWYNNASKPQHGACREETKMVSDIHWFDLGWDGQYKNVTRTAAAVNEAGTITPLVTQDVLEALEQRVLLLEEKIQALQA